MEQTSGQTNRKTAIHILTSNGRAEEYVYDTKNISTDTLQT